jgi:hypothetical protein
MDMTTRIDGTAQLLLFSGGAMGIRKLLKSFPNTER